ncbi:hypothetical protein GCM10019059_36040 [Camelimonas fluminis]|nr:hypothetical protein GCM10019059_36040 [Camelimonas fluminis]
MLLARYAASNAEDFSLPQPEPADIAQIEAYHLTPDPIIPVYCGKILEHDASPIPEIEDATPSTYLAELLAPDAPNLLTILCHAYLDQHLTNILTLASFGEEATMRVHAYPLDALELLSDTNDGATTGFHKAANLHVCEEILRTGILLESTMQATKDPITGKTVIQYIEPDMWGADSCASPNAIALNAEIVSALRAPSCPRRQTPEPSGVPNYVREALHPTIAAATMATAREIPGLHLAVRTNSPKNAGSFISSMLDEQGLMPTTVSAGSSTHALAGLIALQLSELQRAGEQPAAAIVGPENDFLTAVETSTLGQMQALDHAPPRRAPVDPLAMTEQKLAFAVLADRLLTPVIHILDEKTPISQPLIRILSDVRPLAIDTVALTTNQIVEIGRHYGLDVPHPLAERLAAFTPNANDLDGVIRLAAINQDLSNLETDCRRLLTDLGSVCVKPVEPPDSFDVRYVNSTCPIEDIVSRLTPLRDSPIALLLHGAPGTSKTSLARYIGKQMRMPVMTVRMSDIAGPHVGDNEKGIRRAFEQAATEKRFLIFDEADSIIRRRSLARNSWEKSQTNEALTWMESHPIPFACTTNFLDEIDPAAARRFTFKYELLPMQINQARLAWENILKLPPDTFPENANFDDVSISDFAGVAKQMLFLGPMSPAACLSAISQERDQRCEKSHIKIGFT